MTELPHSSRLIGLGVELDITEEAFENIRRGMGHGSEISQEIME